MKSILRILLGVLVLGAIAFAGFVAALRQPTLAALPFPGRARADAATLREHVRFLTNDVRPRSAKRPDNLERTAVYIADRFRAAGGETMVQRFTARRGSYANVVARWGPQDPKLPVLVVGAHYDSFGETTADLAGADDNASGTAGLLELARLLGRQPPAAPVLLVAFTTEEPPFFGSEQMGSAVHANSLAAQGVGVRGMICLEMIGYFAEQQAWPNQLFAWIYPTKGDFIAVVGGWSARSLTRQVKRAMAGAGGVRVVSFNGPRETSDASDHRNYWSHGWPAVMVTDTAFLRNPNYHTRDDTANTLDYERMARVVDGVFSATLHAR
ncbi:MAG: hypothetical protein QOH21_544 [Acidobacteriota bacterium]|nr:hypothetical protein [Acidobacteriota bacterium]